MKTFTLLQDTKQHSANRLHDAFNTAQIAPVLVESNETESRFTFQDAVSDNAIQAVVAAYAFTTPPALVDIKAAWQAYRAAISSATTVGQIKAALTDDLGVLLKELLKAHEADL